MIKNGTDRNKEKAMTTDDTKRRKGETKSEWWERVGRDLAHDSMVEWQSNSPRKMTVADID